MPEINNRYLVNISWLILLRWVASIGQLLTVAVSALVIGLELPLLPLFIVITVTAISNLFLTIWFRHRSRAVNRRMPQQHWDLLLGLVLTMDMISLTVLLLVTGGINNPFCLFFFVNLSLSAVILGRHWAWSLNVLSIFCFGILLLYFWPIDQAGFGIALEPIVTLGKPTLQHLGLFVAFATCASVTTYFMTRLTGALRQQERDLRLAQNARANAEKLEALGTLAAGAAHELASPLSTIAIVAKDLESIVLKDQNVSHEDEDLINDVKLIRSQVDRCRKILDRMAGHAGQTVGESLQKLSVKSLWNLVLEDLEEPDRIRSFIDPELESTMISVPVDALGQSLRGLVQNAIDVEPKHAQVDAKLKRIQPSNRQQQGIQIKIMDHGEGMREEVLSRISEPFFTTKPPGKGMGLGVFLAKNVIERIGGNIDFESQEGQGTTVTVCL